MKIKKTHDKNTILWYKLDKTAFPSRHRTMQAKSILNGSSFSPFIFHSEFISHKAKCFGMCGENYVRSVDTEESKSVCEETWSFVSD